MLVSLGRGSWMRAEEIVSIQPMAKPPSGYRWDVPPIPGELVRCVVVTTSGRSHPAYVTAEILAKRVDPACVERQKLLNTKKRLDKIRSKEALAKFLGSKASYADAREIPGIKSNSGPITREGRDPSAPPTT